jgi:two-component system response regulator YesN
MQYLTNTRIKIAKSLLTEYSSMKLKDIAEHTGYSNQYYFSRIFKSITNMTPTEYRKHNE